MILIGTSGWQYRHWKGKFYPADLPQRAWLSHYVQRFPTVEINNTFYMLPKEPTFDRWREQAPPGFVYVVKANRYITHIRRMREAADSVDRFWSRAVRLGATLGPVLFQCPPNLSADPGLLRDFLAVLPKAMRPAFEFRDASWWRDDVFDAIDRAGGAWVLADRPGWRVRLVVTGGWSYVRFHHGRPFHPAYAPSKLRAWADRIAGLESKETWIFFNNDGLGAAPVDAQRLAGYLARSGCEVAEPPASAEEDRTRS